MAERSHGKLRPSLPQLNDLPAEVPPASDPSRGRDAKGRFTGGNAHGNGRGWKALISRMGGRTLKGESGELAGAAYSLYRTLLAELPSQGAGVCLLCANQARTSVLAARFDAKAMELGLDTDAGRKAAELGLKYSARSERLAISALDLATRQAAAERARRNGSNALQSRILEAGRASASENRDGGGTDR